MANGIAENHRQEGPPPFHEEITRNQSTEPNRYHFFSLFLSSFLPLSLLFTRVYQYVRSIYFQVASLFLSFSLRGVFEER